jgi:hypothetical protein
VAQNGKNTIHMSADYFFQIASSLDRPERFETARANGVKTIAIIGIAMPEELF